MAVLGPIALGLGLAGGGSAAIGAAGGMPGRAWTIDAEGNPHPMFDAPTPVNDEPHDGGDASS